MQVYLAPYHTEQMAVTAQSTVIQWSVVYRRNTVEPYIPDSSENKPGNSVAETDFWVTGSILTEVWKVFAQKVIIK